MGWSGRSAADRRVGLLVGANGKPRPATAINAVFRIVHKGVEGSGYQDDRIVVHLERFGMLGAMW
jgi:hypothetical protein